MALNTRPFQVPRREHHQDRDGRLDRALADSGSRASSSPGARRARPRSARGRGLPSFGLVPGHGGSGGPAVRPRGGRRVGAGTGYAKHNAQAGSAAQECDATSLSLYFALNSMKRFRPFVRRSPSRLRSPRFGQRQDLCRHHARADSVGGTGRVTSEPLLPARRRATGDPRSRRRP